MHGHAYTKTQLCSYHLCFIEYRPTSGYADSTDHQFDGHFLATSWTRFAVNFTGNRVVYCCNTWEDHSIVP